MLTIIKAIYNENFAYPQYNICLLGIEGSGKTKFHNFIKSFKQKSFNNVSSNYKYQYKPTVGLNVIKTQTHKGSLCLWDLGGKKGFRKIWQQYYQQCHGLIFFIDEKVLQGFNCLLNVLFHPDMMAIPLVIISSTLEIKAKVQKQIQQTLKDQKIDSLNRKILVQAILNDKQSIYSSVSYVKIKQIFDWLYDNIEILNKSIKAM